MTAHNGCSPGTEQPGFDEAEGFAASLRQQAQWIDESREAKISIYERITMEDIDTDELRAAAAFIERQRGAVAQSQSTDCEMAFIEACDEAGCAYDNEALLNAIANRRKTAIEECARELEKSYPDHAWLNAACAAIRALSTVVSSTDRTAKNEREMAEGTRCDGLCKDGSQCNC